MKNQLQLLLLTLLLACSGGPLTPTVDPATGTASVVFTSGGLSQRVELSKQTPKQGDTLTVKSTVTNVGINRTIESRICGLDLSGVDLAEVGAHCGGYSVRTSLVTNDSVSSADTRRVTSAPGTYTLKVRHLLDPERWVELKLTVK